MRNFLLSTVAFAALAGSALAADLPSSKGYAVYDAPAPIFSWTGFYLGADIGGGWGNANNNFVLPAGAVGRNNALAGVVGGGFFGYNYQINQLVVGIQDDFQGAGLRGSNYNSPTDTTETDSVNWSAAVNGRLGLAVDRALFYAIGGVAFTQTSSHLAAGPALTAALPAGSPTTLGYSHVWTGYDVGGGVEYAVTNNWTIRAEYRYSDFGSWNYGSNNWAPNGRAKMQDNTATIGVSYLFGAPAPFVTAKY